MACQQVFVRLNESVMKGIHFGASQHTIEVVSSQLDEQGKEVSLAFASTTFCPTRQWYCTMKQELYAIVYSMQYFQS